MRDDHDEPANDDFELEFSDLPLDREPTRAEKAIMRVIDLITRLRDNTHQWPTWASHFLILVRGWLLERPTRQRFADGSTSEDIELEVTDLPDSPAPRLARAAGMFSSLNARFSYKMRLWRVVVILCTIILMFAFLFSTVPQAREWISGLLAHPKPAPTPATTNSSVQSVSRIIIVDANSGGILFQGTAGAGVTPGPAPQGQECPARPYMRGSSVFGRLPVWVDGFDGERATMHFDPNAVFDMVFPGNYAWETTVTVEVQASYNQPVILSGQNLDDGTSIFFSYYPNQDVQSNQMTLNSPLTSAPSIPSSSSFGQVLTWHVTLYFSNAGCYYLQAHWGTDSWTVYFSAGR